MLQAGRNAVEHGAAGLLLLSPADGSPEDFAFPYNRSWLAEGLTIPAFRVNTAVAAALVQDSGKTAADLTIHFTPFHLNTRVRMSADLVGEPACAVQPCTGRNVLGVLPGQNPEYASEVVILGGHYDHMGHSPDGVVWWGANDNASGIAALLEIARVWHEEGFVPQRTVLFAAWDGEELGLLGSSHYAEFPQYPLDKTVGAIQLDMVGAGEETLYIDGSGGLETELAAIASSYSITNTLSTLGRSDHTPFLQAGVPSNLLIWFGGGDGVPSYHRPIDTPAVIEPEKLAGAGRVAGAMALTLAEVEPQIEQMLAVRAAAIENNDEVPFLETAVSERQSLESTWFADVQTLSPLTVTLTAGQVQLLADGAVADVNLALVFPAEDGNNRASTLSFAARFLPGVSGWQWAGANLTRTADGRFTAAIATDAGLDAAEVAQIAARTYTAVAQKLGLPDGGGAIRLYPDTDALRGDTAVTLPPGTSQTVSPGQVNLLYSPQITASETLTRSLVQLALANAGVMEANAPWLWQGLPLAMAAENNVAAAHFRYLPDLREALAAEELPLNEATAYAAMDYLQRRIGWQGIGALVTAVGRSGWDTALRTVVNLDGAGFAQAWQEDWQTRLAAADAGVTAVLDARAEAIQNRNQSAFLNTVDGRMPALAAEQRHWFTALDEADGPVAWAGRPVVLYPDGRLLADTTLTGLAAGPQGARVLFTPEGNGWRWAGALFAELSDEQVTVFYPAGQQALARQIQAEARLQAPQIAADLGVTTTWPVSIKLYASEGMFQTAVSPALARGSWVTSWAGADESVRMRVWPEMEPADWQPSLLAALARQELEQQGVTSQWLLQGVSLWQVERMLGRLPAGMAEGNLTKLLRAVNGEDWPSLADMPSEAALDAENGRVLNAGAVDAVRTVTYRYGREGLAALIQAQAAGNDLETAVFQALGLSLAEFEANWADSLAVAHISSDWLDIANQFNVDRVMVDIDFITQPDFDGRQAGSPGAAAVAAYIAEQFDAVGLRPLGDDIASSDAMSAFGQTFPVRYVTVPAAPRLDVVDADGHLVESFVYREDFVTALDQVVSSVITPAWI
ncbi:MAG: M28 family metallopeptidase [Anaerolineae bacterium]